MLLVMKSQLSQRTFMKPSVLVIQLICILGVPDVYLVDTFFNIDFKFEALSFYNRKMFLHFNVKYIRFFILNQKIMVFVVYR